jgi:hypothetical protein
MRSSTEASKVGHCGTDRMAGVAVKPGATAVQLSPSLPNELRRALRQGADARFRRVMAEYKSALRQGFSACGGLCLVLSAP